MAELFEVAEARGAKRANAIFFHGLDGDAYTTWQADKKDRATFWPAWLAQDIEGLSVYSVGYEAPVSKWHGYAMNFPHQATNALSRLVAESTLVNGTFALVGHSLGGLFITQILRTAQSKARYDEKVASFLGRVKKIVLLGLPEALADIAVTVETWRILTRPTEATLSISATIPTRAI
jgi:pimeloyl-ACP methyl ester carboxylesterase